MKRRNFIMGSAAGMAAASLASPMSILSSCAPVPEKPKTPLNICFQEGIAIGNNLQEKLDYMESLGVTGLEVGGRGLKNRVDELNKAVEGRNIKLSAICAGFDGFILAEDPEVKAAFDNSMREIIAAAGAIGSPGVIMVPAFNGQKPCKPHTFETRQYLCEELFKLGEYAKECGTTVILEPLNRRECFYLRLVGDAAAICRDTNSEGVKCMGDFWHMQEDPCDYAAFMSAKDYLQHVHVASRGRRIMPGEDGEVDNYVQGFRALKELNYPYYVSFECGTKGDRTQTVTKAVELLRAQWELA